jgi:hypothetical protein
MSSSKSDQNQNRLLILRRQLAELAYTLPFGSEYVYTVLVILFKYIISVLFLQFLRSGRGFVEGFKSYNAGTSFHG